MSHFVRTILQFLIIFVVFSAVYIVLFQLPLFTESLLFYRGVKLIPVAAVATFALGLMMFFKGGERQLGVESLFSATVLAASLQLCFFVVVPVTIDRSVSTSMLENLSKRVEDGMTHDELAERFVRDYVEKNDAIGRRLNEQIISKNVERRDGRYYISEQGRRFLIFAHCVSRFYGVNLPCE